MNAPPNANIKSWECPASTAMSRANIRVSFVWLPNPLGSRMEAFRLRPGASVFVVGFGAWIGTGAGKDYWTHLDNTKLLSVQDMLAKEIDQMAGENKVQLQP